MFCIKWTTTDRSQLGQGKGKGRAGDSDWQFLAWQLVVCLFFFVSLIRHFIFIIYLLNFCCCLLSFHFRPASQSVRSSVRQSVQSTVVPEKRDKASMTCAHVMSCRVSQPAPLRRDNDVLSCRIIILFGTTLGLHGQVHLGKIPDRVLEVIAGGEVDFLLGAHGALHDVVVRLEGIAVVLVRGEGTGLDALAQAVLGRRSDDLGAVFLLDGHPACQLVEGQGVRTGLAMQLQELHDRFANGRRHLTHFSDHAGVVEDTAGDLAVSAAQAQHQMEGGLLLDVVVRQSAAVFQLLASKDEALLVRGNALLVLDLGLDVLDGIGRLHIQGDGLSREGLDEDLHLGFCWCCGRWWASIEVGRVVEQ